VPKSLPFLVNTDIAGVIVSYEIRARNVAVEAAKGLKSGEKENAEIEWKLEEVINFFRGLYLFGECNWDIDRLNARSHHILRLNAHSLCHFRIHSP
jgi:hypothetical protein